MESGLVVYGGGSMIEMYHPIGKSKPIKIKTNKKDNEKIILAKYSCKVKRKRG